jgi:hypothetical protein
VKEKMAALFWVQFQLLKNIFLFKGKQPFGYARRHRFFNAGQTETLNCVSRVEELNIPGDFKEGFSFAEDDYLGSFFGFNKIKTRKTLEKSTKREKSDESERRIFQVCRLLNYWSIRTKVQI